MGLATLASMRLVDQALFMRTAMLVFAAYMGRVEILPDNYPLFLVSTRIAVMIFAGLCFLRIFVSLARLEMRVQL
jgi:hypothetical protein